MKRYITQDKKTIHFITFNELSWESGYDYLLMAFSKAVSTTPHKLTMTIIGIGPLYGAVKYTLEDLQLGKYIYVVNDTPEPKEINDLINKTNVYVNFCVKYKPNPADNLALSNNKPIICSDINEFIKNKNNRLITVIPNRNIEMLSENLIKLASTSP
ncbi:MAG: glycosyltransferase [Patescibacteria group bacterium]